MKNSFIDRLVFKALKQERSFSQSGEDKILKHLFSSFKIPTPNFLDIGANHPIIHNNTYYFYRNGSSGVCVEPNPVFAESIRKVRKRDVCLNIGITPYTETTADFFVMSSHSLSTFSREEAEKLRESGDYEILNTLKIEVRNINTVIRDAFRDRLDLVSIDVEGWNEQIVRSIDLSVYRPFCFCIETITFSEEAEGEKLTGISDFMLDNGYKVYADTHINTIFVDREPRP